MNNGVLGPHTGRFLEAGRPEAAMDMVQERPVSGPSQVGNDGARDHPFCCVALIPEEQCILKG